MELRSSRKRNEYKELQLTLNGMGFYEEGMELQEMRQILDALHQSVTDGETRFFDDVDMERALRESEMDFMPSNNGGLWNSTMLRSNRGPSPCSSPEIPSQQIIVHAEVHHPFDWSPQRPEQDRLRRKRLASTPEKRDGEVLQFLENYNEVLQPIVKRLNQNELNSPANSNEPDEKANEEMQGMEELSYASATSSPHRPIAVVGPISMRGPCNDSGVNSPHEVSNTSSPSSSNHNHDNDTMPNVSNSSSSSQSSNYSHIIVGPISARRPINDSGIILNHENDNADSSTSWNFNDNSNEARVNEYFQNNSSLQFRNVYNDDDEDLEHSEPSM
ncbi:uncharacterized protein [Musca autumnalis]|uniref:uncharacterized protein n=1 Tax=Musca autumnalis TaxID=221902 RepID=UPI003CF1E067